MRRRAVVVGLLCLTACQASVTQPETPDSAPAGTPAPATTSGSSTTASLESAPDDGSSEVLRDLAFAYWEAFNAYDTELVLGYLETDYRLERREIIQDDIGRLSTFGVKLDISELVPPVMLGSGRAEMYLEMREPLGLRRIRMGFVRIDGDWLIDFAEESE